MNNKQLAEFGVATATTGVIWLKTPGNKKHQKGLIFRSDRGSNYTSNVFRSCLQLFGVVQSFSRSHSPHDNSVMESFFSSMKREELYRTKYRSERDFRSAVDKYIQYYNEQRPHAKNKYKTPEGKKQSIATTMPIQSKFQIRHNGSNFKVFIFLDQVFVFYDFHVQFVKE